MKIAGIDLTTPRLLRQMARYIGTLIDDLEASFAQEERKSSIS